MKRLLKKMNRRTIVTTTLMLVIFVMSLGYAALSQFIEIEGVALIDRTWNIKVTNVTSSVVGEGVSVSSPYVGSTVTMNSKLPTSTSKVTYTITLKNEGNIRAKLHSIEKVSDKNTNITYTISGVEEGVTLLEPGSTNTVTVVISYKAEITSASNIEKRLMLSFNYVEDTTSNGPGGTVITYDEYDIGDEVVLLDNTVWTVVDYSSSNEEYVALFSKLQYGETYAFDAGGSVLYDPTSSVNIGYVMNNTILPIIRSSLASKGGDTAGLSIRLISDKEITKLLQVSNETSNPDILSYDTWTMTEASNSTIYYLSNKTITSKVTTTTGLIRPVIVVKKINIVDGSGSVSTTTLKDKILEVNVPYADNISSPYVTSSTGIDFSKAASDTNGKGLYYTSTNTEDNKTTYYFRGNVTNNYVKFGKDSSGNDFIWRIVRINEDGSIRIYLNSASSINGASTNFSLWEGYEDNRYVGYMYGSTNASTYAATHANVTSSVAKTIADSWYEANLKTNYSSYIADAGFCNDRSVASSARTWNTLDTALGYGTTQTYYGAYNRVVNLKQPQFKCPQTNDLFTTSSSTKGNKALTYPIAMLSVDEGIYSGGTATSEYDTSTGYWTGTLSPAYMESEYYFAFDDEYAPFLNIYYLNIENSAVSGMGFSPVINLKSCVTLTGGNGTTSAPYEVGECSTKYTVSVSTNNSSYGTVSPSTRNVEKGESASFIISPASGYVYSSNNCGGSVSGTTLTISNVTSNKTCTVTFKEQGVLLANKILSDNTYSSDSGIDFSKVSSDTEYVTVPNNHSIQYYYSNEYIYQASTNTYKLSGGMAASDWVSKYGGDGPNSDSYAFPYTCFSSSSTGTCTTLYKFVGPQSSDSAGGQAYVYTNGAISSGTNGKGLYYTSTNTENNQRTYYFRGSVNNNIVKFAGYYWKIIRINEDGSIRLIYNGTIPGQGDEKIDDGFGPFNINADDNAYLGYMYGTVNVTNYDYSLTHTNTNDSTIKGVLDTWYISNLSSYSSYLADAGFCNDRSIEYTATSGAGDDPTEYDAYARLDKNFSMMAGAEFGPRFKCLQTNDLFTTSTSPKGNKALTFPIGLITADEVAYAGGVLGVANSSYYLYATEGLAGVGDGLGEFWTMTPHAYYNPNNETTYYSYMYMVGNDGSIYSDVSYNLAGGVRPVINLKSTVSLSSTNPSGCTEQNGTASCPYVIDTN